MSVRVTNESDLAVGLSAVANGLGSRKSERDMRQMRRVTSVKAKSDKVKATLNHLKALKSIY